MIVKLELSLTSPKKVTEWTDLTDMFGKLSRVYLPNIFITLSRLFLLFYCFAFIIPVNFEKKNMKIFRHPMLSPR